jgi:hypothetical protein
MILYDLCLLCERPNFIPVQKTGVIDAKNIHTDIFIKKKC